MDNDYFMYELSYVDQPRRIGNEAKVRHSHIIKNAKIEESYNIGQNVVISSDVVLGRNHKIQNERYMLKDGRILEKVQE